MTRKQALQIGTVIIEYAFGAEVERRDVAIKGWENQWRKDDQPAFNPSSEWRVKIQQEDSKL